MGGVWERDPLAMVSQGVLRSARRRGGCPAPDRASTERVRPAPREPRTGQRGDQVMQSFVKTPKALTDRQKELLREFAAIDGKKVKEREGHSGLRRFLSRLAGHEE